MGDQPVKIGGRRAYLWAVYHRAAVDAQILPIGWRKHGWELATFLVAVFVTWRCLGIDSVTDLAAAGLIGVFASGLTLVIRFFASLAGAPWRVYSDVAVERDRALAELSRVVASSASELQIAFTWGASARSIDFVDAVTQRTASVVNGELIMFLNATISNRTADPMSIVTHLEMSFPDHIDEALRDQTVHCDSVDEIPRGARRGTWAGAEWAEAVRTLARPIAIAPHSTVTGHLAYVASSSFYQAVGKKRKAMIGDLLFFDLISQKKVRIDSPVTKGVYPRGVRWD